MDVRGAGEVAAGSAIGKQPLSAPPPPPTRPFLVEVALAFLYPLRGTGAPVLVITTLALTSSLLLGIGIVTLTLPVMVIAYLTACFLGIVQSSAGGEQKPPDLPSLTDPWDDLILPILLVLAAGAASVFPMVAYMLGSYLLYISGHGVIFSETVLRVLRVWASVYFPMAVMSVAIWRSFAAVSPHVVLPAILKIPGQYVLMAAMVWLTWNGYGFVHDKLSVISMGTAGGFLAGLFLPNLVFLYFAWVIARIIGITHWIYRKKIGWFRSM
jgi:hypothetical protein